jgi:hypothetical protein
VLGIDNGIKAKIDGHCMIQIQGGMCGLHSETTAFQGESVPCHAKGFLLDCLDPLAVLAWETRMIPFFVQIKCHLGKSYDVANRLADAEIASRSIRPPATSTSGEVLRG